MPTVQPTDFWRWYSRWAGAIFLAVLLLLFGLKQLAAPRIFSLTGLLLLCVVVALFSLATVRGFYRETRLLDRAYRREGSPVRSVLQWLVFIGSLVVLLASIVGCVFVAVGIVIEIGHFVGR